VLGNGVSGKPEPGLGDAGLDCAPADTTERATNRRANKVMGERCISFLEAPTFKVINQAFA
jgi:hypothetical protein